MNHTFYKNIACAITLACSIQTTALRCGWLEDVTEGLTNLKSTIQKNRITAYIAGGVTITALTAGLVYYLKAAQKLAQPPVTKNLKPAKKPALPPVTPKTEAHKKPLQEPKSTVTTDTKNTLELNSKLDKKIPENLLPFASDEEMREEYMKLWDREQKLSSTEKKQYQADLVLFYQRLFRTIVKKDIKNGVEYTISLGLRIADDGSLTMERLPITIKESLEHNELLFLLSIDPDNDSLKKTVIPQLREFFQKKVNRAIKKSSDSFFPKFVILPDDSTRLEPGTLAFYTENNNTISIREKDFLLSKCETILHEFEHLRQHAQGHEMGGHLGRPITSIYNDTEYPISVINEIDAEESFKNHPHPENFLQLLEDEMCNIDIKGDTIKYAKSHFPYFTTPQQYAAVLKHFELKGNPRWEKFATEVYSEREELKKNILQECTKSPDNAKCYQNCLPLVKFSTEMIDLLNKNTAEMKMALKHPIYSSYFSCFKNINLSNITIEEDKIDNAKNYPCGSEKFFKIKKDLGLLPKKNKWEDVDDLVTSPDIDALNRKNLVKILCTDKSENEKLIELTEALKKTVTDIDVELSDKGNTALHEASEHGYKKIVKFLIKNGANVNKKSAQSLCTALLCAVFHKHINIVKLLIEHGAKINEKNRGGFSALYYAVCHRNLEMITLLIENGADVNAENKINGRIALHTVVYENSQIISYLLKHGANIHAKDNSGETALHRVLQIVTGSDSWQISEQNKFENIKCLVDHGATIDDKAIELAKDPTIKNYLENAKNERCKQNLYKIK